MSLKNNNGIFIPRYLVPILLILLGSIFGVGYKSYTSVSWSDARETFVTHQDYREDVSLLRGDIRLLDQKLDRLIERGNR